MASLNKDGEVLEGFLCPICMQDLVSITQLQVHFEEKHGTEDKLPLFKGLFSKAKKKFLNEDDDDKGLSLRLRNPFANEVNEFQGNDSWEWEFPYTEPSRDHTTQFRKIRSERIDSFVAETNKLLIRLDKLLTGLPSDPGKRKAHEREIVSWADNKDVPLCPFCAKTFTIARRRHHCRLCGAIMCDECSQFLDFGYAEKLISPVHQGNTEFSNSSQAVEEKTGIGPLGSLLGSLPGLRRSNSHGSLNSVLSAVESLRKDRAFRICSHCLSRLTVREKQVEQRTSKPLLSVYYDKLMDYRSQLLNLLPQYSKMAEALINGETTYHLSDAVDLRMRILKLGDSVSMTAQKIRKLGAAGVTLEGQETPVSPDGELVPPFPRQELLQRRIHSSAVTFLKENVLGLHKLPSREELLKTQEKRRKDAEARLSSEREAAKLAEEKAALILRKRKALEDNSKSPFNNRSHSSTASSSYNSSGSSTPRKRPNEIVYDNGWGADTSAHRVTETDDPIVQQMNVIRNYIKQAREANKYDEVSILEANLKELQIEFRKRDWGDGGAAAP